MTKDEAIKQALEALEQIARLTGPRWALENSYAGHLEAITALREALAEQPAQQGPVGTVAQLFDEDVIQWRKIDRNLLVYTSPPAQRKPLTDEQLEAVINDWSCLSWKDRIGEVQRIARAIEAAHGIKTGGAV